jgi:hypothetical protein
MKTQFVPRLPVFNLLIFCHLAKIGYERVELHEAVITFAEFSAKCWPNMSTYDPE